MLRKLDLGGMAEGIRASHAFEYRDPFGEEWGDPSRTTRTQANAVAFYRSRGKGIYVYDPLEGKEVLRPPLVAMIGAKGSGKTRLGAKLAIDWAQIYPGSLGCIISGTYDQATSISAPQLADECERMGYPMEFFKEKKINGRRMTSLYIIDLDGKGYNAGKSSYVFARSFDAVKRLEGIELDWLWAEEIQDVDWESFRVVYTRMRGHGALRQVYIAGMPFDETHWMYSKLPELGAIAENDIRDSLGMEAFDPKSYADAGMPIPETVEDYERAKTIGVLFEPVIFENQKNLPDGEISRLAASLDEVTFERWIYGNRTAMTTDRVVYAYDDAVHRQGRASKLLSPYDTNAPLILSIDFNTRPMCASVWQLKGWNDQWNDPELFVDYEQDVPEFYRIQDDCRVVVSPDELPPADREVGIQIDEFELWRGDTAGLMHDFIGKYGKHSGDMYVLGDATGNRDDTRSGTTDWAIIEDACLEIPRAVVIRGLEVNSNIKTGTVTFHNPPRRDTFNVLNAAMKDGTGRSWVFFNPRSDLKSGGTSASVMSAKKRPDGHLDDGNDRRPQQELVRTHFFDSVRYFVWWLRGGLVSREMYDARIGALRNDAVLQSGDKDHPGGWSVGGWGGVGGGSAGF